MAVTISFLGRGKIAFAFLLEGSIPNSRTIRVKRALGSDPLETYTTIADDVPLGVFYDKTLTIHTGYRYKFFQVNNGTLAETEIYSYVNNTILTGGVLVVLSTSKLPTDPLTAGVMAHIRTKLSSLSLDYFVMTEKITETNTEIGANLGERCTLVMDNSLTLAQYPLLALQSAIDEIYTQIPTSRTIMLGKVANTKAPADFFQRADISVNTLVASVVF